MSLTKELGLEQGFEDLKHEAVLNIVRTATLLSMKGRDLFDAYELTEAQFNVLLVLKYAPNTLTQSDLGKRLVVTRASVTSVLDRLEYKGLVERLEVPDNRRIYHVKLTPKGTKLVDAVEPLYREKIHQVMGEFGDRSCRDLIRRLEQIRERCRQLP